MFEQTALKSSRFDFKVMRHEEKNLVKVLCAALNLWMRLWTSGPFDPLLVMIVPQRRVSEIGSPCSHSKTHFCAAAAAA